MAAYGCAAEVGGPEVGGAAGCSALLGLHDASQADITRCTVAPPACVAGVVHERLVATHIDLAHGARKLIAQVYPEDRSPKCAIRGGRKAVVIAAWLDLIPQ